MNKSPNSYQSAENLDIDVQSSLQNLNSMNVHRTPEIEEWTNLSLIHPVSFQLTKLFIYLRVTPNTTSFIGFLFGVLAASALYNYQNPWMVLVGAIGLFGWHVFDGTDGQLARATGQFSDIGKLVDGLCDHGTNILVYVSVAAALSTQYGNWVWIPVILAVCSHGIQASAMEYYRHEYDYWVHGKQASRNPTIEEIKARRLEKRAHRHIDMAYLWYLNMQHFFTGINDELRKRLDQALSSSDVDHSEVRNMYCKYNLATVRKWTILSTNYRSAILIGSCLIGSPLYYFIAEFTLWNGILIWARANQVATNNKVNTELSNLLEATHPQTRSEARV